MSSASLPKSMQEARFVYELDPNLEQHNQVAEMDIRGLSFVGRVKWNEWQNSVMDVSVDVNEGAEAGALRWMDETIRIVIKHAGARIIE